MTKKDVTNQMKTRVDVLKHITISRIKLLSKKHNESFCVLCPPSCAKEAKQLKIESWYCPMLKGQICDICCYYDMEAFDWPRGLWPNICKKDYNCKRSK